MRAKALKKATFKPNVGISWMVFYYRLRKEVIVWLPELPE